MSGHVHLPALESVRAIHFEGDTPIEYKVLTKISGLRIEELAGTFSFGALNDFNTKTPSLKILTVDYHVDVDELWELYQRHRNIMIKHPRKSWIN